MPRCTRKGCGQEYDASNNTEESCSYHSGGPIFHEGLKSWSCCKDVNKPVLDFDDFIKLPGCTKGSHTDEKPKVESQAPKPSPNVNLASSTQGTTETYSSGPTITRTATPAAPVEPAPPLEEEEEDPSIPVVPGTICRRKGCGKSFISDEVSRGEGEESVCTYHPRPPIFHEGSKGYLCCKRRVLEFDEFMKIEGCKQGKHLFAPRQKEIKSEEFTECRMDHYQTPAQVHVSVFAKQTDKERSVVTIEADQIHLDLYFQGTKRFRRSIDLFGPVDPTESSFKYFGTKVELTLKKADTRSWALLEKTDQQVPIAYTFGVGGRTGTIGSKEIVLDAQNAFRTQS
ncbi:hypothetical protein QCA50_003245 [Cerrena zonata]|uniref:Chord-domain-containing protein n=1 Tax=Cerrena zonata TaxID=2478898 RepID=A0AAW0GKB5_9APHY